MSHPSLDLQFVRKQFPSLDKAFIFMDNAGGSQILKGVMDRWTDYMHQYNVQLGATYSISARAGEVLSAAIKSLSEFIHAKDKNEIILGPSTTALLRILSICISKTWKKGDEIIVTDTDHEANVSCWTDLEMLGFRVKVWKMNKDSFELDTNDLKALLSERTRIVAVTHCSNILGTINPIKNIAKIVHEAGALICVDGVAFAPHREVNVVDLDVDFYAYSYYKTFGPHAAVLYGKKHLLESIPGINHYFIKESPYKFQPGNYNFENAYALQAIPEYWKKLYSVHYTDDEFENKVSKAIDLASTHEEKLAERLISFLNNVPEIKIIGSSSYSKIKRVPTISFVHDKFQSNTITSTTDAYDIGIRFGDFYAKKLVQTLGLGHKNGVVRISLVHYNTLEEVDQLIEAFKTIF